MQKQVSLRVANRKDSRQAIMMILPMMAGFILFTYVPIFYILRFAFFNYNGFRARFIGMDNFIRLFTRDIDYWKSITVGR